MAPKLRDRPNRAVIVEEVEERGDTVMSDSPRLQGGQDIEQEATSANSDPPSQALQTYSQGHQAVL